MEFPQTTQVKAKDYNMLGQEILADGFKIAGKHILNFDASGFSFGFICIYHYFK
jgi:hypothetical protein|tara:strand:- start:755 stop:916 length:162 start_codon:yes stop_codon:yes gene_type:complete